MLSEFIDYLIQQIGQPYLWGGQHTKLTPENYEAIIHRREDGRGTYSDGQTYADAAIEFCRKAFNSGAEVLYAYDCSGLGMYWIADVKHIWTDRTADSMMRGCVDLTSAEPPRKGWWAFKQDSHGKATHIGYMIDDEYLIEAKGRRYGVCKTKWKKSGWSVWGIPSIFYDEIVNPEPDPPEPPPEPTKYVEVIGGSVRVRDKGSTKGKHLFTAHNSKWYKEHGQRKPSDAFPLIAIAPSGWYQIQTSYPESYISNKANLTKLVEV